MLKTPPAYKKMPTRYRWYVLTAENCYAQELGEGAAEIRDLTKKLPEQLKELKDKKPNQGIFVQTLFGTKTPAEIKEKQDSQDTYEVKTGLKGFLIPTDFN